MAVDPELVRRAQLARDLYVQQPVMQLAQPIAPAAAAPAAMAAPAASIAPAAPEPAPIVPAGEVLGQEANEVASARRALSMMRDQEPEPWRAYADPNAQIGIVNENVADQGSAARATAAAQSEGAQQKAALFEQRAKETDELGKRSAESLARYQATDDKIRTEFAQLDKEAAAIEIRDRRTTADQTRQAIARALAAVGTGFARMGGDTQSNYSNDLEAAINAQVEQDLRAQIANANNKRERGKAKLDEWALARGRFDGEQDQQKFAHALIQQKHAASLEAQAARTDDRVQAAQYGETAAKLRTSADVSKMEIADKEEAYRRERAEKQAALAAQAAKPENYYPGLSDEALYVLASQGDGRAQTMLVEREKSRLSNEKMRKDIETGPAQTADERKLQRLMAGVKPSADILRQKLGNYAEWRAWRDRQQARERAGVGPDLKDVEPERKWQTPPHPYADYKPDIVTSPDTLEYQASLAALRDILLRDESGASIADHEKEGKIEAWGIDSGDPDVRAAGLWKMLHEYEARAGQGTLPPSAPRDPRDVINQALTGTRHQPSPEINQAKSALGFKPRGAP